MSGAAEDKEQLAREFAGWKGMVEQLLSGLPMGSAGRSGTGARAAGNQVWSGPAAERFTEELRQIRAQLERLPGGFERTAHNLKNSAHDLRSKEHP
ncbi:MULTISPECIES: hypothetical protein [Streptomyces]|uniref:hypothetical protein n=1 Tax=Streptomyces TaxID=1883 RepID=UPI0034302043